MKVLFVSWELDPFFKFGGLGDIARSLPTALKKKGVDIRNMIPFYKALRLGRNRKSQVAKFNLRYGGKREKVEIYEVMHPRSKVLVYLVSNKHYLDIAKGPDTFAFFDKAVVESCRSNHLKWQPEIIHCNDHHTGLIPLLSKETKLPVKTVLTIHNLGYQGRAALEVLEKLGIDTAKFDAKVPLSLSWSHDDEVLPAKILYAFAKKQENLKLVGGVLGQDYLDVVAVKALAVLPGKDELRGRLVGVIASPLRGLASVLSGNLRNLVYALNAIAGKK